MNHLDYFSPASRPVEACVVGSGGFGRSFIAQGLRVPLMSVRVAVDIDAAVAAKSFVAVGVPAADDINLVVTTALMQDRLGRTWPTGVVPDEPIAVGGSGVLDAALAWAGQSPGCAA